MPGRGLLPASPDETVANDRQRVAVASDLHCAPVETVRVLAGKDEKAEGVVAKGNRGLGKVEAELLEAVALGGNEDVARGDQVDDVARRMPQGRIDRRRYSDLAGERRRQLQRIRRDKCARAHQAYGFQPLSTRNGVTHEFKPRIVSSWGCCPTMSVRLAFVSCSVNAMIPTVTGRYRLGMRKHKVSFFCNLCILYPDSPTRG